jgi:hypothetical protein
MEIAGYETMEYANVEQKEMFENLVRIFREKYSTFPERVGAFFSVENEALLCYKSNGTSYYLCVDDNLDIFYGNSESGFYHQSEVDADRLLENFVNKY